MITKTNANYILEHFAKNKKTKSFLQELPNAINVKFTGRKLTVMHKLGIVNWFRKITKTEVVLDEVVFTYNMPKPNQNATN